METLYLQHADGSISSAEVIGPGELLIPEGSTKLTKRQYNTLLDQFKQAHAEHVADLIEQDKQRTRADFEALTAVGIPHDTARRMSGYEGE